MAVDEAIAHGLPSGRKITLRFPTVADRERVTRRLLEEYKDEPNGVQRALMERETLLMGAVLLSDGGQQGGGIDPDEKRRFDAWDVLDLRAYTAFYTELTSLSDEEERAARDAAKSVRKARYAGGR